MPIDSCNHTSARLCYNCQIDNKLEEDAATLAVLRQENAKLQAAARALLSRNDFWDHAGTLPGEYDTLKDLLEENTQ